MEKLSVRQLDVEDRTVLLRVDYNVPLEGGAVRDDSRIRATLPTIRHLLGRGARLVLLSHLGRPKGRPDPAFSLRPAATRLGELLDADVAFALDCIGPPAETAVRALRSGQAKIALLENLRFHPEEEANDASFASALAALGERYVNDAFGAAHRAHASVVALPRAVGRGAAGLLMERELKYLGRLLTPDRPFVAIVGGAKISGKIDVLEALVDRVDTLVVGGAMMFTFLRAQGVPTGRSLVEEDRVETAAGVLERARARGVRLVVPEDCIATTKTDGSAPWRVAPVTALGPEEIGVDIGPVSIEAIRAALAGARTVFWNGPMGIFEREPFAGGTFAVARLLADATAAGATTVVGGGDSVAALVQSGLADRVSHVSTGGGASLEFVEGRELPGVAALSDAPAPSAAR